MHICQKIYFVILSKKVHCSFQQGQAGSFKVSISAVLEKAVPCLLTDVSGMNLLIGSLYFPVRKV
jgi:hypothetical protein